MRHDVKKQFWLSKKENNLLAHYAKKTCLSEAGYLRMLLNACVPREKPGEEFYEAMNQIRQFTEKMNALINQLEQTDTTTIAFLNEEIQRWHEFQLDIEKRFLAPEEMPWR